MACSHSPQWHLSDCNEDGWKCAECGHAFGFRPDFDREHTRDKVETILFWLVEHDFVYVSNASEGDGMVASVAKQCHQRETYDQQSVVAMIALDGLVGHARFWKTQAEQFFCPHGTRTLRSGKWVCDKCGHETPDKGEDDLPLFASKEPF